ncbi:MAG: NADH-quinone oxidoreductase subunit NuoK [Thermoplasmataceae archaeon]
MFLYIAELISLLIFTIGLTGVMTSNVGIKMLISIELMLNASIFSLVAVAASNGSVTPLIMALFAIAIGAAESVIGISLLVSIYKKYGKITISLLKEIRW